MSRSKTSKGDSNDRAGALFSELMERLEKTAWIDDGPASRLDQEFKGALAEAVNGMSPIEIGLAYLDWLSHLAISPGKQLKLTQSLAKKGLELGLFGVGSLINPSMPGPASQLERRVGGENWRRWPFNVLAHAHQVGKDWWQEATSGVAGVSDARLALVRFIADQVLDLMSPANYPWSNPDVLEETVKRRGANLLKGAKYFLQDSARNMAGRSAPLSDQFQVGRDVAITPGKIVFRNELIELIQYEPTTGKVGAEPVLMCPAWIMKYYIMDLSPKNSLVRYLVEQGKTVFMISWRNPGPEDRDIGFEDYVTQGLFAALDAVRKIVPRRKVHAVGYCIGGTLMLVGAATLARDGDERLKSLSLFTSQGEFSEAGEVLRFISDSQLEFVDKYMWKKGVLGSDNMGGTFGALRASDLIYHSAVDRYLMGNEPAAIDLMAWNADGTRMPYRMHSEYLHKLYLRNELARNKFVVGDKPISLQDIRVPIFNLGTETDHVAPWRSVYKLQGLTNTDVTFVLTSGGHNAGVISGPVHPRRRYRMHTQRADDRFIDPDTWLDTVELNEGSWWPAWNAWLDQQMSSVVKPPRMGAPGKGCKPIEDAPGTYVFG
jgi:polyhydroxyalkanoate synthase